MPPRDRRGLLRLWGLADRAKDFPGLPARIRFAILITSGGFGFSDSKLSVRKEVSSGFLTPQPSWKIGFWQQDTRCECLRGCEDVAELACWPGGRG